MCEKKATISRTADIWFRNFNLVNFTNNLLHTRAFGRIKELYIITLVILHHTSGLLLDIIYAYFIAKII